MKTVCGVPLTSQVQISWTCITVPPGEDDGDGEGDGLADGDGDGEEDGLAEGVGLVEDDGDGLGDADGLGEGDGDGDADGDGEGVAPPPVSVMENDEAGSPAPLYRLPWPQVQMYCTETGFGTDALVTSTVLPTICAVAA